jgi:hypothetical protein
MALVCLATPSYAQFGGFGGPSILSRGGGGAGRSGGRPITLRPHVGLSAYYSKSQGEELNQTRNGYTGAMLTYGVVGQRSGRRDFASVSLAGNQSLYTNGSGRNNYGGMNLRANYGRQLSARTTFFLGQGAQYTNNVLFGRQSTPFSQDPEVDLPDPAESFFDSRSYFFNSGAGISHQASARISISLSGGAFFRRYSGQGLVNINSYQGAASLFYLLSRKSGVGASYSYGKVSYNKSYGEGNVQNIGIFYSRSLTPRWSAHIGTGVYRVDFDRLVSVAVDPFIARITGQSRVAEAVQTQNEGVSGMASLSGNLGMYSVNIGYNRGVTPGNGFIQLASRDNVNVNVSYRGIRDWNIGASTNYGRTSALVQDFNRSFEFTQASINVGRQIVAGIQFNTSAGVVNTRGGTGSLNLTRFFVSVGLSFSPGTTVLPIF